MSLTWSVVTLVLGLALLGLAVHFRVGGNYSARRWADQFGSTPSNVLLILPGVGLIAVAFGTMRWTEGSPLMAVGFAVIFLGIFLILWGGFFDVPLWAVPRWAREKVSMRRQQTRGTWKYQ